MAIAAPRPQQTEAPTQETGTLPRLEEQERRRVSLTLPRIAPGRYLAMEDGEDILLFLLAADNMHIGRSPAADILLDDASVSRRHALITQRGERTVILDDRSLNGVQVNGIRVSEAELKDGDVVLVGHVTLRFVERYVVDPESGGSDQRGPYRHLDWSDGATPRITPGSSSSPCCWRGWRLRSRRRSSPPRCRRSSASSAPRRRRRRRSSRATCSRRRSRRRSSASSVTSSARSGPDDRAARLRRRQRGVRARAVARRARAGRVIQGVGGGIFPLAFGIIRETFPPERVSTAIGGISATFGIGGGVGLVIAGPIVEALDASWLFWLGLMALPAAFAIWRYVPREETRPDARVDWLGAALLSVALAAFLYGLSKANAWGWDARRACSGSSSAASPSARSGCGWRRRSSSRWSTCACCAAAPC